MLRIASEEEGCKAQAGQRRGCFSDPNLSLGSPVSQLDYSTTGFPNLPAQRGLGRRMHSQQPICGMLWPGRDFSAPKKLKPKYKKKKTNPNPHKTGKHSPVLQRLRRPSKAASRREGD